MIMPTGSYSLQEFKLGQERFDPKRSSPYRGMTLFGLVERRYYCTINVRWAMHRAVDKQDVVEAVVGYYWRGGTCTVLYASVMPYMSAAQGLLRQCVPSFFVSRTF